MSAVNNEPDKRKDALGLRLSNIFNAAFKCFFLVMNGHSGVYKGHQFLIA
jgi:hypothetical protein